MDPTSQHEANFIKKLIELQPTQQSINSVALWVMYHSKKYKESVELWKRETIAAPPERKLTLLYLANDIMQNSRKKTQDFIREFGDVMYEVIEAVWPRMPSKDRKRLERMLGIWGDRSLFPSSFIRSLKRITEKSVPESPPGSPPASVVNSAKRDSRSTSHSEDEIAKRVLAHPVVQALMELEKNRMDKQAEQAVKGAFDTATKNMVQESALGNLGLDELQKLREEYESHVKQLSDFCNQCTRENSRRARLVSELHRYEKNQKERQNGLNMKIQEWTRNMTTVQKFVTQIEVQINQKKMEARNTGQDSRKRGQADAIDDAVNSFGDQSADYLLAQVQKRPRTLELANPNPNPFMATIPTSVTGQIGDPDAIHPFDHMHQSAAPAVPFEDASESANDLFASSVGQTNILGEDISGRDEHDDEASGTSLFS